MNQCQLMGRLTKDPELRQTQTGIPVASFSIAIDRRKGKDGTQETDFFNIVAWRHTAEFVSRYFAKGQRIAVVGQIQNREYQDKEGVNRRTTEIIAESVFFADSKREDEGHGQGYASQYQQPQAQGGYQTQPPSYQAPATGYQPPAPAYQPPAQSYQPPAPQASVPQQENGGYSSGYSIPPQGEHQQFQTLTTEEEGELPF